jgi:hypothetical protein
MPASGDGHGKDAKKTNRARPGQPQVLRHAAPEEPGWLLPMLRSRHGMGVTAAMPRTESAGADSIGISFGRTRRRWWARSRSKASGWVGR